MYFSAIIYGIASLILLAIVLWILIKPFFTLLFILRSKRRKAEVISGTYFTDENGSKRFTVTTAVYEDKDGVHHVILRDDDTMNYFVNRIKFLRFGYSAGDKITIFADPNGYFTMWRYLFAETLTALILAVFPAFLLAGTGYMFYCEITDYGLLDRILSIFR